MMSLSISIYLFISKVVIEHCKAISEKKIVLVVAELTKAKAEKYYNEVVKESLVFLQDSFNNTLEQMKLFHPNVKIS